LAAIGCEGEAKNDYTSVAEPPTIRVVHPTERTIVRTVGQPSFIESYERTSIYPKMTAYIEKWIVDIGDKVKKDQTLATLFVPELVEDHGTKKADVELEKEKIDLALKVVDVADADVKAAEAAVAEAEADLKKYQSEVDRWAVEVGRLQREVDRGVVDKQVLLESQNQLRSSSAARDAAKATITKMQADLVSREAALAKAKVDVGVAKARLAVAQSEERRLKAWVDYLTLMAPFDGVIVARNANTMDFVLPASGDLTAMRRAPDISTTNAAPIYVVDRTDVVRIFVDIPEQDANYVQIGTKATVLARAYKDKEIEGSVTRTSWALNVKSRTLRAEIDLPNPNNQLLPGMYAYAKVHVERPGVLALPREALLTIAERTYCMTLEGGKAARTELEVGVTDGEWVEVTNRRRSPAGTATVLDAPWTPIDGTEQVILGDLSVLTDGAPVKVGTDKGDARSVPTAARPSNVK
jgi:multidrug efflux pump subunit AcrA (membrane-fusion protein)